MLNSDALQSFIASPMQAERSSADGLNSASAVLGSAKTARLTATITLLRSGFIDFSFSSIAPVTHARRYGVRGRAAMIAITKSRFGRAAPYLKALSGFLSAAGSDSTLL
jgi:hypothetical protein